MIEEAFVIFLILIGFISFMVSRAEHDVVYSLISLIIWLITWAGSHWFMISSDVGESVQSAIAGLSVVMIFINIVFIIWFIFEPVIFRRQNRKFNLWTTALQERQYENENRRF